MPIEIDITDDRWLGLGAGGAGGIEQLVARACDATLRHLGHAPEGLEISVLACDDARIRHLNTRFRGKEAPTNVLSWPTWDLSAETAGEAPEPPELGSAEMPEELGDMALAYETCAREAEEQGKLREDHVTHLVVHSTLHLLGYDHETDADAELMEGLERLILAQLGIDDPYAADHHA
ncbi:rRNA maturation RNase YbeY [Pararhodobacter oceanensis]|uniref:rRNA maturation RNase YbeY n=1 Tax=Pararhodobacter oceanensis TaxID=2172121 RepID=UPI003A93D698